MAQKKIDVATQLRVLAMIARRDTYAQISETTGLPISTVQSIKERNSAALADIQDKLVAHEVSSAKKLLNKSQALIERKLDKAAAFDLTKDQLDIELREGKITIEEYRELLQARVEISITELNAVQREAFHQSQIEAGKPTSITDTANTKDQLLALAQAIKDGVDEVELYKMVFKPKELHA